jgi:dsRNA-specific ribonuclease
MIPPLSTSQKMYQNGVNSGGDVGTIGHTSNQQGQNNNQKKGQQGSGGSGSGSNPSGSKTTPISMLQELCQKLNKTPRYDLLTMEGRAHQPSFVFRCTVGDVTGEGHGTSKKQAKHAAAENVLNQLKQGIVPGDADLHPKEDVPKDKTVLSGEINPVGTLQELVVSRGWRLPDYQLASEAGPAHKKEFIICCSVEKLKEYGNGTSKKVAKRNAAGTMLARMRDIPADSKDHVVEDDIIDNQSFGRGSRGFVPIEMLRNSAGDRILIEKNESGSSDALTQLYEHSRNHQFKVEFLDIKERSTMGLFQCLLRLNTLPVSVVHGQGANTNDSHNEAARNALLYLKVMANDGKNMH